MKKVILLSVFFLLSWGHTEPVKLSVFGDFLHFVYRNEDIFLKKKAVHKVDFSKLSNQYRVQVMTEVKEARGSEELSFYFKEKPEALSFLKQLLSLCSVAPIEEISLDALFKEKVESEELRRKPIVGSGSSIVK